MTKIMQDFSEIVHQALAPDVMRIEQNLGEITVFVYTASIVRVLSILRDHPQCQFRVLIDICGVDNPEEEQRFQVVYHLLSLHHNYRIRVKVLADETMTIPSVTEIFNAANWYEREVWDLYGIPFSDHPDLRRILTDYMFEGHPLRKDFPLSGFVETRYDNTQKRVIYEPIKLKQDFRNFDFLSPWEGALRQTDTGEGDVLQEEKATA